MTTKKMMYKWGRKPQVENRDGRLILSIASVDLKQYWGKITRQLLCGSIDVIEVWNGGKAVLHIVPPPSYSPPARLEVGEFKLK